MLEIVQGTDSDLIQFLDFLFGNAEGYVYTSTKDISESDPKKAWRRHFYEWPRDREAMVPHIKAAGKKLDIYIAPALFSSENSAKGSVKGSHVFWVDLDGKIPDNLGDVPPPSLVIQSSHENRQHWYWRVDEFITDIPLIERVNRGLAYTLGADVSGWDANQVLRPPETFNHKRQAQVSLLALSPWTVNPSSFSAIPEPPKPETEFSLNDLLDSALLISKYEWPKQAFNLYRTATQNIQHKEGRSGALMQVAYFCAEMGMHDQEIFTILYNADERWGKFKDRPDRARRLNDIIVKARIKHPFKLSLKITELPVFGFNDFLKEEVKVEWVIPGMLETTGQLLLSAAPGVGKSRLSLSMCIRLALGRELLHYAITEQRKLIFFSMEMGHAQLHYFLEKMGRSYNKADLQTLQENLLVVPLGEALYLDRPAGQRLVESALEKHEVSGYIFDSLSRTTSKSVNDEESLKTIMDWDASIRNRYSVFSWYVHHNRKATVGNKKPKSLDDLLGATVIAANCSAAYTLWREKPTDKEVEMINVKQRVGETEHPFVITTMPDLSFAERGVLSDEIEYDSSPLGLAVGPPTPSKSSERLGF